MKVLLEGLLPRLFPDLSFQCIAHEGKHDLEKSIPRKLRAWREPGASFAVLRDNDRGDCKGLKHKLQALCKEGGRPDSLIRIACQELEAWYIGEPDALAEAYGDERLRTIGARERYREPDTIDRPSDEVKNLVPEFHKVLGARKMAAHLSRERNLSPSFRALLAGLDRYLGETKD